MSGIPFRMDPAGTQILPAGYRLCEYLESTGTQYIDLIGITYDKLGDTELEFSITDLTKTDAGNGGFFLAQSGTGFTWYLPYITVGKKFLIASPWDVGPSVYKVIMTDTDIHKISTYVTPWTAASCYFDGEKVFENKYKISPESYESSWIPCLFCFNDLGTRDRKAYERVYSLKIKHPKTKNLVLNFIPALAPQDKNGNPTPNGTPCMFDTVTQKPFYNAGTGTFQYALASTPPHQSN